MRTNLIIFRLYMNWFLAWGWCGWTVQCKNFNRKKGANLHKSFCYPKQIFSRDNPFKILHKILIIRQNTDLKKKKKHSYILIYCWWYLSEMPGQNFKNLIKNKSVSVGLGESTPLLPAQGTGVAFRALPEVLLSRLSPIILVYVMRGK